MASYPKTRPANPFPYFTEVMTGFEYVAAIGMLYEGQTENGLKCITNIRNRYDGRKRSPFDEAECGHHYGRAMASWSALLALSGFHYSGVNHEITFGENDGTYFWSNGYSYGTVKISGNQGIRKIKLHVLNGQLDLKRISLEGIGTVSWRDLRTIHSGETMTFEI